MSSRINTANSLAMNASSAFHALSSECIQYAKMLEERDEEIKELKNSIDVRERFWENQTEELSGMNKSLYEENQKRTEQIQ